ncbi:hypothetical protein QYE76_019771 [Lolium multiflorum]|uniref:F-box domain-containing protein n=1 Tax=Lolium multiflorum TaxID=4521 RepID=A0AAD8VPE3_LOLMU|nr:hypothetical protein QYE76_019771 [Lolium multiflorum]
MPPGEKHESAPPARGADLISSLPDHLLHHVLSFLPAQAAVETCLLARRWRHLWRYTTGLRITGLDGPVPAEEVRVFVDHLLILRERTDLDTVEIKLGLFLEEDQPYLKLWARFAVMCKVRALTFHIYDPFLYLDEIPLVSRHLRTLDLQGLGLGEAFLDFASCPALEHLKMAVCDISVDMISSRTLKHLSITNCHAYSGQQVHLSTPGLISLKLDGSSGMTPTLENMASLETAFSLRPTPDPDPHLLPHLISPRSSSLLLPSSSRPPPLPPAEPEPWTRAGALRFAAVHEKAPRMVLLPLRPSSRPQHLLTGEQYVETPGSRRRPPAHHRGREYSQHAVASLNRRRRPTDERLHDQSELHCHGRVPRRAVPRIVASSAATEERIHAACAATEERRPAPPRHASSSPTLVGIGPSFVSIGI